MVDPIQGKENILGDQFIFDVVGQTMEGSIDQSCRVPVVQTGLAAEVDGVIRHHFAPLLHAH